MPDAAIAANVLESRQVLRDQAAKMTLDHEAAVDQSADLGHLFVGEVARLAVVLDTHLIADRRGKLRADPVDGAEGDLARLVGGDVYSGDAWHTL